ncbi:unnamed protein product [Rotaria sordida]|uniref:Uncharacterized protein n=1 Tax=Rotaria sordida TaxID=392033 RepID=A0A819Q6B7_9BILA|nr:unnamed protein product [Rotaria sordida]
MERILLSTNYPKLTKLKLFNFKQEIALRYFTNESPLRHIFRHQITDLILETIDQRSIIESSEDYIKNNDLPNLKCFSLKCYHSIDQYDDKILPLLHRMSCLEKLTLYIRINNRNTFIDDTHLQNEIFLHMPRLHSFTFYICTYIDNVNSIHYLPYENIRQHVAKIVNYINTHKVVCSIFSLPFAFDRLEAIGNIFPKTVFKYVTYLLVEDIVPFNHEFFIRVGRAFPLLNIFRVINEESQSCCDLNTFSSDNNRSNPIAEYPHLTVLDLRNAHFGYVEQFLNETKTYLPCLTELTVFYTNLRIATKNFTREETRRNCAKVKQLFMVIPLVHSKDFYLYFPSL